MEIMDLFNALPGAVAQGLIWGIMAIGVYITYKVLDVADLTVDGTMCTGGAVCAIMMIAGYNMWISMLCAVLAGALAGLLTGSGVALLVLFKSNKNLKDNIYILIMLYLIGVFVGMLVEFVNYFL